MNTVKFILSCVFLTVLLIFSACKNKGVNTKEINIKLDSLSINGKSLIEKDIAKENGVFFVKAHLRKQIVTIVYDTTKENINQLIGKLEKMGYKTKITHPPVPEDNK
jgi:copper chaperone CopZ